MHEVISSEQEAAMLEAERNRQEAARVVEGLRGQLMVAQEDATAKDARASQLAAQVGTRMIGQALCEAMGFV